MAETSDVGLKIAMEELVNGAPRYKARSVGAWAAALDAEANAFAKREKERAALLNANRLSAPAAQP
jgi:hypothetical protein